MSIEEIQNEINDIQSKIESNTKTKNDYEEVIEKDDEE